MTETLAKQLALRMKAQNISAPVLEKMAGVGTHGVLNIIRGKSKQPSAQNLHAITTALGCTISDLLDGRDIFCQDEYGRTTEDLLNDSYVQPDLLVAALSIVNQKIAESSLSPTVQQVFNCVQETYVNALQRNLYTIDPDFIEWFLGAAKK